MIRQTGGSAAAETAMVAPLIVILLFSAMEIGNLFYNQHTLTKAVRDGARYAARQPFSDYDMGACSLSNAAQSRTRRLVRTAQLAASGAPSRLPNWEEADEASTIDVTVVCDGGGTYKGVYIKNGNVASAVTVEASVPYTPIIGFVASLTGRNVTASSQAAVAGV